MKRLLCLLLISLTLGCHIARCESANPEFLRFEPTFTSCFEFSPEEWFSSEDRRALLTILLTMDFPFSDELNINLVTDFDTSFVSKSNTILSVTYTFPNESSFLVIAYEPMTGDTSCTVLDGYTTGDDLENIIVGALSESSEAVYKNDRDTLINVIDLLIEILQ